MRSLDRRLARRFDAALFDMDGTLIDSETSFEKAWHVVLAKRGINPSGFDYEAFRGLGGDEQVREVIRRLGLGLDVTPADLLKEWVQVARPIVFAEAKLCPGAEEMLDACDRAGVPKALVTTSTTAYSERILAQVGIMSRFRFLITRTTMETLGSRSKPAPYPYLLACWRFRTEPIRALVFEDSEVGVKSAKAAGCRVVAVSHAHPATARKLKDAGADVIVDSYAGLDLGLLTSSL